MKDTYIKTLIVNLGIIIVAFTLFIFIDASFLNAGEPKDNHKTLQGQSNEIGNETEIKSLSQTTNTNFDENTSTEVIDKQETIATVSSLDNDPDEINIDSTTTVDDGYDYRKTSPFQWSKSHYKDYNYINENTSKKEVYINSNKTQTAKIAFYTKQKNYYRFEIAKFVLKGNINPYKARVAVFRNGKIKAPYLSKSYMRFRKVNGQWEASWFYNWKTPIGKYKAVLYYKGYPIAKTEFKYISRKPVKFNRAVSFVTLEANTPMYKRSARNTKGQKVKFTKSLIDWMEYGDIDGFFNLSGETTGWNNCTPKKPWAYYCVRNLQVIGKAVHKTNKLVGAYIMCFYTPGTGWTKGGYTPSKAISFGSNGTKLYNSQFISFRDKKRFNDIVELAKYFDSLPYNDMIGFDFVRFGEHAGLENVDDFVREMNIPLPKGWYEYTKTQRMYWMGRKVRGYKNSYKRRWNLWKAHRTAEYIYQVRKAANLTKPIWVFTLGWNHGTQHGQDPNMFMDAGVLSDHVMLYEATPAMFQAMAKSWKRYLKYGDINYIPGNQIDSVINKSKYGFNPVEEYYYRLTTGSDYQQGGSQGIFIHDMSRAFWSRRRGGHSYYKWLISGFSAVSHNRRVKGEIPFELSLPRKKFTYRSEQKTVRVPIKLTFTKAELEKIQGKTIKIESFGKKFSQKLDITTKTNVLLYIRINPRQKGANYLAIKAKIEGYPSFFAFRYLKFRLATTTPIKKNKVAISTKTSKPTKN